MAKRIVLGIFGGIAIFGLIIAIIGFALGGRGGHFSMSNDGQFVYYAGGQSVNVGRAPSWIRRWVPSGTVAGITMGPTTTAPETPAPFTQASQLKKLSINIDAGYVVVQPGKEFGLHVDGTLPYSSEFKDGTWYVTAQANGIHSRYDNGWNRTRFWLSSEDVTTTFVFTVPADMDVLQIKLGMGAADISGFTLKEADCETDLGTLNLTDVKAEVGRFDVEMGGIKIKGYKGVSCELECEMGNIDFEGSLSGEVDVNCAMGSVEMRMPRPASYGWNMEVGMGRIRLDGHRASGLSVENSGGNEDARPFFSLRCDMGSIEVKFT